VSATRENLLAWLKHVHGFELEVPFTGLSGKRRFRWDAALPERMIAVEYQGLGAGHQWAKEQARDQEKASEASLLGWTVVYCGAELVNNGRCFEYVDIAMREA
jgi:hypothetical protein